ncbi:unnamed protein product [Lactuca saligna]|uniref:Uncharacterized protein n=1 Tax=Lactuca saligna TaxID=75948 RepID=A0AA35ZVB6_LACSI|nr:unnamed protein product [Lactuca saligna]
MLQMMLLNQLQMLRSIYKLIGLLKGASRFLQKCLTPEDDKESNKDVNSSYFYELCSSSSKNTSFGSKNWPSVYLASTPQQAAELGLNFPSVDEVTGTSGKALLVGGNDNEGVSTEAQICAIIEVLGIEKRNEVLVALYMVRTDVSHSFRQFALHVWKTIVVNTPKTLKEIMSVLMNTLMGSLASSSSERQQVAGRSLGELVRKLRERVLPLVIPILSKGLKDPEF